MIRCAGDCACSTLELHRSVCINDGSAFNVKDNVMITYVSRRACNRDGFMKKWLVRSKNTYFDMHAVDWDPAHRVGFSLEVEDAYRRCEVCPVKDFLGSYASCGYFSETRTYAGILKFIQ